MKTQVKNKFYKRKCFIASSWYRDDSTIINSSGRTIYYSYGNIFVLQSYRPFRLQIFLGTLLVVTNSRQGFWNTPQSRWFSPGRKSRVIGRSCHFWPGVSNNCCVGRFHFPMKWTFFQNWCGAWESLREPEVSVNPLIVKKCLFSPDSGNLIAEPILGSSGRRISVQLKSLLLILIFHNNTSKGV